jgi:hypothetical protein
MLQSDLDNRFSFHPATDANQRGVLHEQIRDKCLELATFINGAVPEGREKSSAVTKIEEAMFWANGAVAREPS